MKRLILIALLVTTLASGRALAGYSVGGSFLAPGYGARAWAMAGAATAVGSNESAVYWNPALLSLLPENRVGASVSSIVPGTDSRQAYLAWGQVLKRVEAHDGYKYARHAAGLIFGNTSLELSDGQKYTENTVRLAYAWSPRIFLSFGVGFAGLVSTSDVSGFHSNGTAIDFGVRTTLLPRIVAAFVARNALSNVEFDDGVTYSLPRSYTLALAVLLGQNIVVEGDVVGTHGAISDLKLGGEYSLRDRLWLRGGVAARTSGESRLVPHGGFGVRLSRLYLDYNADLDSDSSFDTTHRVSLAVGF